MSPVLAESSAVGTEAGVSVTPVATVVKVDGVLSSQEARDLTWRIKVVLEGAWELIVEAYHGGAHRALGYSSWDDYCTAEFGTTRIRMPKEDRQEVVTSLRDAGLSTRAISAAVGIDRKTVRSDLAEQVGEMGPPAGAEPRNDRNDDLRSDELLDCETSPVAEPFATTRSPVTGIDGKSYSSRPAKSPRRHPLTDTSATAIWKFRKAVERLERIVADDRFESNRQTITTQWRGHIDYAADVFLHVADRLGLTNETRGPADG